MTARKQPHERKRLGPKARVDAQRPSQYCMNAECRKVFRRRANYSNPCPSCGWAVTTDPKSAPPPSSYHRMSATQKMVYAADRLAKPKKPKPDYERHSIVIAGATSEWNDERVAALLRAQRDEVLNAK